MAIPTASSKARQLRNHFIGISFWFGAVRPLPAKPPQAAGRVIRADRARCKSTGTHSKEFVLVIRTGIKIRMYREEIFLFLSVLSCEGLRNASGTSRGSGIRVARK